jgi:hypothetical protein
MERDEYDGYLQEVVDRCKYHIAKGSYLYRDWFNGGEEHKFKFKVDNNRPIEVYETCVTYNREYICEDMMCDRLDYEYHVGGILYYITKNKNTVNLDKFDIQTEKLHPNDRDSCWKYLIIIC